MARPDFPAIPFDTIREPFDTLCQAYINKVDREWPAREPEQAVCSFLVEAILRANYNAYKTVLFLCAESREGGRKPEYSLLAAPINRMIADSLYTLVFLFEDRVTRASWYFRSGWRERVEELRRYESAHGSDPAWHDWLEGYRGVVEQLRAQAGVTAEEAANPKLIKHWPLPSRMKKDQETSMERRAFFSYLDDWFYKALSSQTHLSGHGLPMQVAALLRWDDDDEGAWKLDKARSDNFMVAITLVLSLLSEVEIELGFGMKERLLYVWWILNPYYGVSQELFKFRYAEHLAK